jgi:hypothetical protein
MITGEPAGFWVIISVAVILAGLLSIAADLPIWDSGTIVITLGIGGMIIGLIGESM